MSEYENEYPYDLVQESNGLWHWECGLCATRGVSNVFSPNLQKHARMHIKNVHNPARTEKTCPTCGHTEVVWE